MQFAVAGTHAGQALAVMGGEDELQGGLAGSNDLGSIGQDLHAFLVNRVDAGGNETAGADDLDEADTAGADGIDVFEVAQGRDVNTDFTAGFQNGSALSDGILSAVDFNIDLFH